VDVSPAVPIKQHTLVERWIEQSIFASRWLLAPFYLGLAASLLLLLIKFGQKTIVLASHAFSSDGNEIIVGILSLVDLSLMGNLLLMVMFAGYENFISKLDVGAHKDKPSWMGHVGFADLKLKLMTSIVAISAIHVLEVFMNIRQTDDRTLAWAVGIHMAFIISGVLLAIMDRLSESSHK